MRTVNFVVVLHEEEWIEIKVAKEGDVGSEWDNYEGKEAFHSWNK
jgi:hypothetical protein